MTRLCQSLPLLLMSGCFLMHSPADGPGESDAGRSLDAGRPPPVDAAPPPPDASRPRDATPAPPDAMLPLMCPERRADFTCLESFAVEPERSFELPIGFAACGCCNEMECGVDVDRAAKVLRLTTTLCPDPCDCDGCVVPEGQCRVPGLEAGLWRVEVNGEGAFELPVDGDSDTLPAPHCVSYPESDLGCGSDTLASMPVRPAEVCVRPTLDGRLVAHIPIPCPDCGLRDGLCHAILEPRLEDLLPDGADIRLWPSMYATDCDVDCLEPVCMPRSLRCELPPVVDGDFYRVFVNGVQLMSFTGDLASELCGGLLSVDVD